MGYVDSHMMGGERVLYRARLNGAVFIGPIILLLLGLVTAVFIIGIVLVIVAIIQMIRYATVEVAVTDRRVIGKIGVISTNSVDLILTKVESVSISRGLLGAMFGFGSVTVSGGHTRVRFPGIDSPETVRRAFLTAAEAASAAASAVQSNPTVVPPSGPALALFDVEILDRVSGEASWVPIRAGTAEEAAGMAARTGAIVGKCRLKAIG